MDRRIFLKIMGAASAGYAGYGCGPQYERFFDLENDMRAVVPLSESFVNSTCQLCGAGCGIRVRVANGDVISVGGNSLSPVNRGNLCMRGLAGAQHLYSDKRIKNPLLLDGEKGSGNFREISWNEAQRMIIERLKDLRNAGRPQEAAMINGNYRGLSDTLFRNFFSAYGSPNYLKIDPHASTKTVLKLMHGEDGGSLGFDMENTNYILNFGVNLFESSASPVWHNWIYGHLRRERRSGRAKLVHIAPMGNVTAYKSDEWIKIKPGTYGALALGIANVMIRRNFVNTDFIESQTFGFERWTERNGTVHTGFRELVLEKYGTREVSEITGVPIHIIEDLTREFVQNQPAMALFDDTVAQYPGGIYNQMSVYSLNALAGNIGSPGGMFVQKDLPYTDMPEIKHDETAVEGLKHQRVDRAGTDRFPFSDTLLPGNFLENAGEEIDMLFINDCNPVYSFSENESFKEVLHNIPFVVNFSSFQDDTTPFCDLLLPDPTFLEKWKDVPSGEQTGFYQVLGLMKPVIPPLYNTRPVEDVFLRFASELGSPVSKALPWNTFEEILRFGMRGIFDSRTGLIFSGVYGKSWVESLEQSGWRYTPYSSFDDFWSQITESGGWWNPLFPANDDKNIFNTPSGKLEFFSQVLYNRFSNNSENNIIGQGMQQDQQTDPDENFLPHFESPEFSGNPSEFPLILHVFETGALRDGKFDTQPSLLGVLNAGTNDKWDSWVELNQATAEKYNLHHNNRVVIESPVGKIRTTLKIRGRIVDDAAGVPLGLGHNYPSGEKRTIGVNPNSILAVHVDRISGLDTKLGTRVRIYRDVSGGKNA